MKNISTIQNEKFINTLNKKLIKLGAVDNTSEMAYNYPLMIDTKAGLLNLKIDLDNTAMFTLYARFESLDRAKEQNILPSNKHNPKWNLHIVQNCNKAIEEIILDLSEII